MVETLPSNSDATVNKTRLQKIHAPCYQAVFQRFYKTRTKRRRIIVKQFCLISIILLAVNIASAQFIDDDYIGDNLHGDQDITGNVAVSEIMRASGILGNIHTSLPYIGSATHSAWINIGTRILAATDTINPSTPTTNWYTAKLIDNVTEWVMDYDTATGLINNITAITINSSTAIITNITSTTINSSTAIVNNIVSNIINSSTVYVNGTPIAATPTTQWYTGDHSVANVTLDSPAYDGTLHITCITDPDISHPIEWVEDYHYTTNLDGNGYIESVTPLDKWYIHTTFRFWYTKKQ